MCCCHGYRTRTTGASVPARATSTARRRTCLTRGAAGARARDLEDYLEDLEDELARVRRELQELREPGPKPGKPEGGG